MVPVKAARKKRRLSPEGCVADRCGDETALGGGQTAPEARWHEKRRQISNADGRAAVSRRHWRKMASWA